jgi:hypothetical protein
MSFEQGLCQKLVNDSIVNNNDVSLKILLNQKRGVSDDEIRGMSFIVSGLNYFLGKKNTETGLMEYITDGTNDNKIDAIIIEKDIVSIFDFKCGGFTEKEIIDFLTSVEDIIINNNINDYDLSGKLKERIKKIRKIKNPKIILYIARLNGGTTETKKITKYKKELIEKYPNIISIEFLNSCSLVNLKISKPEFLPISPWKIKADGKKNEYIGNNNEIIVKVKINEILKYLESLKKNGLDLFFKNVRNPEYEKNFSLNILETIKDRPNQFHLLHNGITIVSEKIDGPISGFFTIIKPQVVNGAQTLGALYKNYWPSNKNYLKNVYVYVKIIKADNILSEKICETANTQKSVNLWDLRSNDDIQMFLEMFFNENANPFCNFIRQKDKDRKINLDKISFPEYFQWVYSCCFNPVDSKNKKKYLFSKQDKVGFYNNIESKILNLNIIEIEQIAKIGLFVREQIKKEKIKRTLLKDADMHIIGGIYFIWLKNGKDKNNLFELYFKQVLNLIEKKIKEMKNDDPLINNNKIFTKSHNMWDYIKNELKK